MLAQITTLEGNREVTEKRSDKKFVDDVLTRIGIIYRYYFKT